MLLTPSSSDQDFAKLEKKPLTPSTSLPVLKHKKSFFSSFGRNKNNNHSTPPATPSPSKVTSKSNIPKQFSSAPSQPTNPITSLSSSWAPSAPSDEFTSPYPPFSLSPISSNFTSPVGGTEEGGGTSSRRGSISELLLEQGMIDSEWISLDPFDEGFSTGLPSLERNLNGGINFEASNSSKNSFFYPSPISPSNISLPPTIDSLNSSHILKTLPSRRDSLQSAAFSAGSLSTSASIYQQQSTRFKSSPSTESATSIASPQTPISPSSSRFSPLSSTIPPSYNSGIQGEFGIAGESVGYSPLHAFYGSNSVSPTSATKVFGASSNISTPSILPRSTLTLDVANLNRRDSNIAASLSRSTTSSKSNRSQENFDSPLPTTPTRLSSNGKKTGSISSGRSSIKKLRKEIEANQSSSRSSTPLPSIQSLPEFGDTFDEHLFATPTTMTDIPKPPLVSQDDNLESDHFVRLRSESKSSVNESRRESEVSPTAISSLAVASAGDERAEKEEEEDEDEEADNTRRHSVALSQKLDSDLAAQENLYKLSLLSKKQAAATQIETVFESAQEEIFPPIVHELPPRFEFALVIFPSTILVSLLTFLPYRDFQSLMSVSNTLRSSFNSVESSELILQRYLGSTVGYKSLKYSEFGKNSGLGGFFSCSSSDMAQSISSSSNHHSQTLSPPSTINSVPQSTLSSLPLRLNLQDLQAFKVGQKYSLETYAKLSAQHMFKPLPTREVKRIKASTRAWNRVLLRLREQYELVHGESVTNAGWREVNVFKDLGIIAAGGRTPIYKSGRAIILRVWVPLTSSTSTSAETIPTNWMSDIDVENCETEMRYCYPPGQERVRRGDIVHNISMGDFGNEGRLLFDGKYLRDFCFEYDSLGHLPPWIDSLELSPGYYHNVIGSSVGPNPIFFISLKPFIAQIRENLALQTEKVLIKTLHSNYNVKKFIYRSYLIVKPNTIIGSIGGAGGNGPGGILMAHEDWVGTLVLETEGTTEAAVELMKRCEREEGGAWRVVREKSRVGRIWLNLVGEDERVR